MSIKKTFIHMDSSTLSSFALYVADYYLKGRRKFKGTLNDLVISNLRIALDMLGNSSEFVNYIILTWWYKSPKKVDTLSIYQPKIYQETSLGNIVETPEGYLMPSSSIIRKLEATDNANGRVGSAIENLENLILSKKYLDIVESYGRDTSWKTPQSKILWSEKIQSNPKNYNYISKASALGMGYVYNNLYEAERKKVSVKLYFDD